VVGLGGGDPRRRPHGRRVIGVVGWRAISNGPQPQAGQAMNMGCTLLPQYRGHGYGTTAQRLLVEYLFDTFPIHRVEAITDVENLASSVRLRRSGSPVRECCAGSGGGSARGAT
jgi:RimJ/RimL family protein N-acetyltransferase